MIVDIETQIALFMLNHLAELTKEWEQALREVPEIVGAMTFEDFAERVWEEMPESAQ